VHWLILLGHVKADCPSMRGSFGFGPGAGAGPGAFAGAQKCYQCGRPGEPTITPRCRVHLADSSSGHIARMCPGVGGGFRGGFAPRGGFAGGFNARPRQTTNPDGTPVKC
jgi:cellular nucleic acid-binding protein